MGSRRHASRWNQVTLVAVAGLHAALFLLLARALTPSLPPVERDVAVTPVYLARLEPERPKPRKATAPKAAPPRNLPVPTQPPLAAAPGPAPVTIPAETADGEAERARLAGALRASRVGCANLALLTERERVRCEDRLAAGATNAKYIPTPLPPERRAYYDAVAKAKQPFHAEPMRPGENPVPAPSPPAGGLAALQSANEKFNIPLAGCKISFGAKGFGVVKPPHGLKLGPLPCYITPPQGPFTVEANIRNPDTVVKGKD